MNVTQLLKSQPVPTQHSYTFALYIVHCNTENNVRVNFIDLHKGLFCDSQNM